MDKTPKKAVNKIYLTGQLILTGLSAGILNGLLGAGGGIIAVAALTKVGLHSKEAHATSIALILPLTICSLVVYAFKGNFPILDVLPFVIPALGGSIVGAWLLKRMSAKYLRLVFSILVLYSAYKTLSR